MIDEESPSDLMNSRSEWGANSVPRVTVHQHQEQVNINASKRPSNTAATASTERRPPKKRRFSTEIKIDSIPEPKLTLEMSDRPLEEPQIPRMPDSVERVLHRESTETVNRVGDPECDDEGQTKNQEAAPETTLPQEGPPTQPNKTQLNTQMS